MKFAVEVGEVEKNCLEYHSNQLLGSQTIKINNRPIKRVVHLVNEPILEVHSITVGFQEKTTVRIEKQRRPLMGYTNRVYVNDRLLGVFRGL